MAANANNALFFLVTTLFELYLGAVLLRILLAWVRADFYNPLSQLVWKLTQPVIAPLTRVVPRWRRLDTAALALLTVLALLYIQVVCSLVNISVGGLSWIWFALLKLVLLLVGLYTLSLFAQAILSWVGPGINNPAANILFSVNEPLLRPVRRVVPPIANLDLSPLFLILALQVVSMLIPLPGIFR
ncbi:MAG TPA: YggT family protein [Nevskiaceae bacterium]|nr:YggT family protein [Nevskiaceae bacterium]